MVLLLLLFLFVCKYIIIWFLFHHFNLYIIDILFDSYIGKYSSTKEFLHKIFMEQKEKKIRSKNMKIKALFLDFNLCLSVDDHTVTVKYRTAIKTLFLSEQLDSLLCSLRSISFRTNSNIIILQEGENWKTNIFILIDLIKDLYSRILLYKSLTLYSWIC
jgi:hypothetical protein